MYDESTVETMESVISSEPTKPKKLKKSKTPASGAMSIDLVTAQNTYCMDGGESGGDVKSREVLNVLNHKKPEGNYIWFSKSNFPEGTTAEQFLKNHFLEDIDEVLKVNEYIGKSNDVIKRGFVAPKNSHIFGQYLDPDSEIYSQANPNELQKSDHFCVLVLTERLSCSSADYESYLKNYSKRLNNGQFSSRLDKFSKTNGDTGTKFTKAVDYIKNDQGMTISQCAKLAKLAQNRLINLTMNSFDTSALDMLIGGEKVDNS